MSEAVLQEHCVQWFKWAHKNRLLWHTPNGGFRYKREAEKLKRMGVRAGVPDLAIMEPSGTFHGLFVELKFGKNDLTDNQEEMCRALANRGYRVAECRSLEEFRQIIEDYFDDKKCA